MENMTTEIYTDGLTGQCVSKLYNYLMNVAGVKDVYIDITQQIIRVEHHAHLDPSHLEIAVERVGVSINNVL